MSSRGAPGARPRLARIYELHGEKVRYLLVGMVNTAVSYVLFLALLAIFSQTIGRLAATSTGLLAQVGHAYYLIAQWVGWVFMVPVSTTTMKYFAFRSGGRWLKQVGRAYLIYLPAQGLSSLLLWLTVRVIGMSPPLGQFITIVVTTVFSYVGHKYFTFRTPLATGEVDEEVAE